MVWLGFCAGEVYDGVVCPGEICDVAEFYPVAGGENAVESVSGFVHGFGDLLGEANVQALQEGGGVGIVGVVDVEIEVAE